MSDEKSSERFGRTLIRLVMVIVVITIFLKVMEVFFIRPTYRVVGSVGLSASGEANVIPTDYILIEEAVPVRLKGYIED